MSKLDSPSTMEMAHLALLSPDLMCAIDEKGTLIVVNDTFASILQRKDDELKGENFFTFIYSDDISEVVDKLKELKPTEFIRFIFRLSITGQGPVQIDWSATKHQNLIYLTGRQTSAIGFDAENTLENESLNAFLKYAPAAIAFFDTNMRYLAASQRWYSDYSIKEEIIGKSHYEVFPMVSEEWKQVHAHCLQGNIAEREEDSFVDVNSKTQWIKWAIHPWYTNEGKVGGIIMFTDIITEQKQGERELLKRNRELEKLKRATLNILEDVEAEKNKASQEKEKLSLILQSIGDGVVVMDQDQKILLTNKITSDLTGYSQSELIGQPYYEVLRFVDKFGKPFTKFIDDVYERGLVSSLGNDVSLVKKDGEVIAVSDSAAPIKINDVITGCIVIFRDATQERKVDQMKSDFVSIASHQLRTPLTAVKWYAELLSSELEKGPDEHKQLVNEIVTSNHRMIMLVNDLLSVSRIERDTDMNVKTSELNLNKLVEETIKENSALTRSQEVKVLNQVPQDLEITADKDKLFEVLKNLVNNGVKYSSRGGQVEVAAELVQPGGEGNQNVRITVTDHGIGIPEHQKPEVFRKFFRADNATRLQTEGNGLGLYIVKSFVEAHKGQITFESEEGKGTKFIVTLPNT